LLVVPAAWFGGTSRGIANFLVLQWLGVRLAEVRQRVWFGEDPSCVRHERWSLLRWVCPLTGWWSPMRWIAKRP
jgi:hypothetical protein